MMKLQSLLLIASPVLALAWIPSNPAFVARTRLQVSNADDSFAKSVLDDDKPCWQDIWSYDCAMSNAYSAAFIPAQWIKKLPCALGLADCDTPEKLKRPAMAKGSGVENVDVMGFLNIKRVDPIKKEGE